MWPPNQTIVLWTECVSMIWPKNLNLSPWTCATAAASFLLFKLTIRRSLHNSITVCVMGSQNLQASFSVKFIWKFFLKLSKWVKSSRCRQSFYYYISTTAQHGNTVQGNIKREFDAKKTLFSVHMDTWLLVLYGAIGDQRYHRVGYFLISTPCYKMTWILRTWNWYSWLG